MSARALSVVALAAALLAGCGGDSERGAEGAPATAAYATKDGLPYPDLAGVEIDVVRACDAAFADLQAEPDSAMAWGKLGMRYFAHEFFDEAEACFRRAGELDPENPSWPYRLGWTLFDDRLDEAMEALELALERQPDYAPLLEILGRGYVRQHREDEGYAAFQRAAEIDASSAHALTGMAQIELARGRHDAAREHLEAALALDDKHVEAHIALAQAYLALGRTEEAREHAERSRELPQATAREDWLASMNVAPAGAQARTRYGLQLQRMGRDDEAAEQFRIALESNPYFTLARRRSAQLLERAGERARAIEVLREGLELQPGNRELENDLAKLERE